MSILEIIKQNGFFALSPGNLSENYQEIADLYTKGIVGKASENGLNIFNGDYMYVLSGNPDKIYVKQEGCVTFLAKP